jgi:hypothetical protein
MGIEIEGAVDGGMAGKEAFSRFLRLFARSIKAGTGR